MYLLVFICETLLGYGRDHFALEQNLHRNLHQLVSAGEALFFLKGGKQGYHDVRTEGRGGIRGRKGGQRCLICSECSANEGASTVGAMGGCANGDVEGGCLIGDQRTDGKNFRRLRGWEPVVGRVAQPL